MKDFSRKRPDACELQRHEIRTRGSREPQAYLTTTVIDIIQATMPLTMIKRVHTVRSVLVFGGNKS